MSKKRRGEPVDKALEQEPVPETEKPLPGRDDPDHFRALVQKCIAVYEELGNSGYALDYCEVGDKRLRAMILDDEEYKRKTKSIFARQRLEEVRELKDLKASIGVEPKKEKPGYVHPSEQGKGGGRRSATVDRDLLNMRFKAAEMTREVMADMAKAAGDAEQEVVNMLYVPITREEFERLATVEVRYGSYDADFSELVGHKEDMPTGTRGNLKNRGNATAVPGDGDFFDVGPGGEIVERD